MKSSASEMFEDVRLVMKEDYFRIMEALEKKHPVRYKFLLDMAGLEDKVKDYNTGAYATRLRILARRNMLSKDEQRLYSPTDYGLDCLGIAKSARDAVTSMINSRSGR